MIAAPVPAEVADIEWLVSGRRRRVPDLGHLIMVHLAADAGGVFFDQLSRRLRAKRKEGAQGKRQAAPETKGGIIHYPGVFGCG